jgi:tripartite-type tricarboxylate transporter receptor subunit TctC
MITKRRLLAGAASLALAAITHHPARADSFPSKPIKLMVGYTPGGTTDILARAVAHRLSEKLGQPVVVDNRPGAAGGIASELTARAAPDGYTLLMATASSHGINPAVYSKLTYDPVADFQPVAFIASVPLVLAATPAIGVADTKALIALIKSKPGAMDYASSGNGSPGHLAGEVFRHMAGLTVQHIPYRGGAPSLTGVIAGETQYTFGTLPATLPHVRSGKLTALAVTTGKRSSVLPQVPTVAEVLPGYEVNTWNGILAPKGAPAAVVTRLNEAVAEVMKLDETKATFAREGAEPEAMTPAEFGTYIASGLARWAKLVKETGTKVD